MTTTATSHYESWAATTAEMRRKAPDLCKGFGSMYQQLMGDGALSLREKELIAAGIGMAIRCKPCLFAHVEKAVKAGATREQLLEMGGVVVTMQGGPAYTHIPELLEALDALGV